MKEEIIAQFAQSLRGSLIGRDHPEYEEARKLYNAMIDKRPLLIARCADVADVIAAVNFGRDNKLPIAIRGGGHNGPGPRQRRRRSGHRPVDDEGRQGRPQAEDGESGRRAAPPATSTTRPTPSVRRCRSGSSRPPASPGLTLSGGHGYLSRQYGLAVDNLIEADVVLADGRFVTASETENADLFWALRGGGGNFGVVTSFLFRTNPASMVYGGPIIFELADAPAVMKWFREFQPKAPEEFYMFLGLQSVPPADPFPKEHWSKKMCVLLVSHNGPPRGGREGRQRGPRGAAEADHRLGAADALHGDPDAVRPAAAEGPAMVLEGRLRERTAGRGHRRASRACREASERALRNAPLSDRRRRPSAGSRTRPPGATATRPGRW